MGLVSGLRCYIPMLASVDALDLVFALGSEVWWCALFRC